jgi:hypothetical protein
MKALISPNQDNRIAQVQEQDFPVAEPLFWADCPENCTTEWAYVDGEFLPPQPYVPTVEENKQTAVSLLQQTDWVNEPDVRNPENSPHLLNAPEFDAYRVAVRQYAVYPVEGNIDWPVIPEEQWSN